MRERIHRAMSAEALGRADLSAFSDISDNSFSFPGDTQNNMQHC